MNCQLTCARVRRSRDLAVTHCCGRASSPTPRSRRPTATSWTRLLLCSSIPRHRCRPWNNDASSAENSERYCYTRSNAWKAVRATNDLSCSLPPRAGSLVRVKDFRRNYFREFGNSMFCPSKWKSTFMFSRGDWKSSGIVPFRERAVSLFFMFLLLQILRLLLRRRFKGALFLLVTVEIAETVSDVVRFLNRSS